jgi:tetrahydromethanopterin S-methyltransferase subunit G
MKKIKFIVIIALLLSGQCVLAEEVPYTLEDRDRLIRVETKIEQIDKRFDQIDRRFEQVERRIERLETVMMWGFGLLFTTMIGLVGFVLWDRRSALSPAIRKNKELEEREDKIEKVLKEYAYKEPRLAEILRNLGLM